MPDFSLFTIHCSLFTIHYSLFTVHFSLFTSEAPKQVLFPIVGR